MVTDYFSKWVEAIPLPNQTAEVTADALLKMVIHRHGPPRAIVSDRGPNFTSKVFRAFCRTFNIKHKLTTAYNPASNGQTERYNRTLTTMLRKELAGTPHYNWEKLLGEVCFAYRNSVHSSTNETPYYLLHGRDPNTKINNFLHLPQPDPIPSASDYIGDLTKRLRYSFELVRKENRKAHEQQSEQYNKRAKLHQYRVGDRVLLDVRTVGKDENKKFVSKYKGHYRVVKVYQNGTIDIEDDSHKIQKTHINRLKPLLETMLWTETQQRDIGDLVDNTDDEDSQSITSFTEPETVVHPTPEITQPVNSSPENVQSASPTKTPDPTDRIRNNPPIRTRTNLRDPTLLRIPIRYR